MYYNTLNFAIMYNFKGDHVSLIIESENEYTQLQIYKRCVTMDEKQTNKTKYKHRSIKQRGWTCLFHDRVKKWEESLVTYRK
jgi:hypothetical protein